MTDTMWPRDRSAWPPRGIRRPALRVTTLPGLYPQFRLIRAASVKRRRAAFSLSGIYARFPNLRISVTVTGYGSPAMRNFMGLSDHGPKTLVIVDEIAADEQALKSLTDDVCATFGTYGLSLPSIPHHH